MERPHSRRADTPATRFKAGSCTSLACDSAGQERDPATGRGASRSRARLQEDVIRTRTFKRSAADFYIDIEKYSTEYDEQGSSGYSIVHRLELRRVVVVWECIATS